MRQYPFAIKLDLGVPMAVFHRLREPSPKETEMVMVMVMMAMAMVVMELLGMARYYQSVRAANMGWNGFPTVSLNFEEGGFFDFRHTNVHNMYALRS